MSVLMQKANRQKRAYNEAEVEKLTSQGYVIYESEEAISKKVLEVGVTNENDTVKKRSTSNRSK